MSRLPEELLADIFLALPVESIFNCKCVCKFWRYVISTPKFIKYHLKDLHKNNNHKLVFVDGNMTLCSIDYTSMSSSLSSEYEVVQMSHPFKHDYDFVRILGSSNGLICLYNSHRNFIIWNPLTREYKTLSTRKCKFCVGASRWGGVRYGFGYDCANDDYKLVIMGECKGSGCWRIQVYTLGSDSWSNIQPIPLNYLSFDISRHRGVSFNENLHWLGTSRNTELILAFSITDERIADVPLPETITSRQYKGVGVLEECLCLAVNEQWHPIDIWVMQDYGVRDSWARHFRIYFFGFNDDVNKSYFRGCQPIWKFENGEILMDNTREFVLHDPRTGKSKKINIGRMLMSESENYVGSLVSLNSGTYVDFE